MGTNEKFLVIKTNNSKEIRYFEYDKINGYKVSPKNNTKFEDAININKMIIINPSLIEKVVDRKIKIRFNYLINLLTYVYDNLDDGTSDGLFLALDEAEKFRMELYNKYRKHLKEEKFLLLTKKLDILEDELKLRIKYLTFQENEEYNLEGKHR